MIGSLVGNSIVHMFFQQLRSQFLETSFGVKPVESPHGFVYCMRHQLRYDTVRHNRTRV